MNRDLINHFEKFIFLNCYDKNSTNLTVTMRTPCNSKNTSDLSSLILFPLLENLTIKFSSFTNESFYFK